MQLLLKISVTLLSTEDQKERHTIRKCVAHPIQLKDAQNECLPEACLYC